MASLQALVLCVLVACNIRYVQGITSDSPEPTTTSVSPSRTTSSSATESRQTTLVMNSSGTSEFGSTVLISSSIINAIDSALKTTDSALNTTHSALNSTEPESSLGKSWIAIIILSMIVAFSVGINITCVIIAVRKRRRRNGPKKTLEHAVYYGPQNDGHSLEDGEMYQPDVRTPHMIHEEYEDVSGHSSEADQDGHPLRTPEEPTRRPLPATPVRDTSGRCPTELPPADEVYENSSMTATGICPRSDDQTYTSGGANARIQTPVCEVTLLRSVPAEGGVQTTRDESVDADPEVEVISQNLDQDQHDNSSDLESSVTLVAVRTTPYLRSFISSESKLNYKVTTAPLQQLRPNTAPRALDDNAAPCESDDNTPADHHAVGAKDPTVGHENTAQNQDDSEVPALPPRRSGVVDAADARAAAERKMTADNGSADDGTYDKSSLSNVRDSVGVSLQRRGKQHVLDRNKHKWNPGAATSADAVVGYTTSDIESILGDNAPTPGHETHKYKLSIESTRSEPASTGRSRFVDDKADGLRSYQGNDNLPVIGIQVNVGTFDRDGDDEYSGEDDVVIFHDEPTYVSSSLLIETVDGSSTAVRHQGKDPHEVHKNSPMMTASFNPSNNGDDDDEYETPINLNPEVDPSSPNSRSTNSITFANVPSFGSGVGEHNDADSIDDGAYSDIMSAPETDDTDDGAYSDIMSAPETYPANQGTTDNRAIRASDDDNTSREYDAVEARDPTVVQEHLQHNQDEPEVPARPPRRVDAADARAAAERTMAVYHESSDDDPYDTCTPSDVRDSVGVSLQRIGKKHVLDRNKHKRKPSAPRRPPPAIPTQTVSTGSPGYTWENVEESVDQESYYETPTDLDTEVDPSYPHSKSKDMNFTNVPAFGEQNNADSTDDGAYSDIMSTSEGESVDEGSTVVHQGGVRQLQDNYVIQTTCKDLHDIHKSNSLMTQSAVNASNNGDDDDDDGEYESYASLHDKPRRAPPPIPTEAVSTGSPRDNWETFNESVDQESYYDTPAPTIIPRGQPATFGTEVDTSSTSADLKRDFRISVNVPSFDTGVDLLKPQAAAQSDVGLPVVKTDQTVNNATAHIEGDLDEWSTTFDLSMNKDRGDVVSLDFSEGSSSKDEYDV